MAKSQSAILASGLLRIYPTAQFTVVGKKITEWTNDLIPEPSDVEIEDIYQSEISLAAKTLYQERRKAEYPPVEDYVDAKVLQASPDPKDQQAGADQEKQYIEKCLAIKAKYPKPE